MEGKLEFPSHLALVLVSHWIGVGILGSIYTNSSYTYCYEYWAMGHIPTHMHTHAEPNWVGPGSGPGGACPRPEDMNAIRFRGFLRPALFLF